MPEDPSLEELKEALRAGNLVLVVGEGISEAAGLPGRRRLVAHLVDRARASDVSESLLAEVETQVSKDRLIDALSALEEALGANDFRVAVQEHLNDRDLVLPAVFEAIGAIAPSLRAVLTTNLDQLIERSTGSALPTITKATGDLAQRRGFILKLHGTLVDRSTWVLTRRDHDAVNANDAFNEVLLALFFSDTLLFVGCELTEDVFEKPLQRARAHFADQPPRHFALIVEDSGKTLQRKTLANAGVKVVTYEDKDGKHNDVARILRGLVANLDLRRSWPNAIAVTAPPPLESYHICRSDIVTRIAQMDAGGAIELVGISGSGKTHLATETLDHILSSDSDCTVYYVEVRNEDRLRNALVGCTFELQRVGFGAAFALAIRSDMAEEQVIRDVARSLGACNRPILILVDLVEGTCNSGFARDLATFVRSLASNRVRIAILGQEQALRDLTPLERKELGVEHLDVRGFHFQEFVALVGRFHAGAGRTALYDIFERITAGRSCFLSARLAHALARAESLDKMAEIAASPADTMLSRAEKERFDRVSAAATAAAEKLVCFLLPFRQEDAQAIFPDDSITRAVHELLALGLLGQRDADRFEMHETVRAGLEMLLGTGSRRRTHEAIAAWYRQQGLLTAEILHLEKCERRDEAHQRARKAFLAGEHWEALAAYVAEHHLVTALEVIDLLTREALPNNAYLLPAMLRRLGDANAAEVLLQQVRQQKERFDKDYNWAWKMVEAIICSDVSKLYELLQFALESDEKQGGRHTRLGWIQTGARRVEVRSDERVLELFRQASPPTRLQLLPILLIDRRRAILAEVFEFLKSYEAPVDWRSLGQFATPEMPLRLEQPPDIVEFLAALPTVEPSKMIVARSALLGPFSEFIWSQHRILREQCIEILQASVEEETILENAIRVLLFLGEQSLLSLCEPLLDRKDRIGSLAKLLPALVPTIIDKETYERRLLDPSRDIGERTGDITILAAAGANIGMLLSKVRESDPEPKQVEFLEFMALTQCAFNPFEEAIPLLEEHLSKADAEHMQLFAPLVIPLGSLSVPSALDMLLRALCHPDPNVRLFAAIGLGTRRSRRALPRLLESCAEETNDAIAQSMAVAAMASGPRSSAGFETLWPTLPSGSLWRCIFAARLRDSTASEYLVACANDPANHWQIRRAAILAAGRLPYEDALEKIAPVVLQERSPFHIDQNHRLLAHSIVSLLTSEEASGMLSRFVVGRDRFVGLFGDIFEGWWHDSSSRDDGLPTGEDAANWLFDRLTYHGWPHNKEAPDMVVWELHIPILHAAVLRALRLCGKPELIEEQISGAYHSWFVMKCVKERAAVGRLEPAVVDRLELLAAASKWSGSPFIANMFRNLKDRSPASRANAQESLRTAHQPSAILGTPVQYQDIVRALKDINFPFDPKPPIVCEANTAAQHGQLVTLLDPGVDYRYVPEPPPEPALQFVRGGYSIGAGHPTRMDNRSGLRALLRPAVAAGNGFRNAIPWHRELLNDGVYIQNFLACLVAQNDAGRFYEELNEHAEQLVHGLGDANRASPILKFIDTRIVPFLRRYSGSGTDAFLEVLCSMAGRVDGSEIDAVLATLFYRWSQRFDHSSKKVQHSENHSLWRALDHLSRHPRFFLIRDWETRLSVVMKMPIPWFHKKDIVRILERSPRAYVEIESMLMRTADFEHYFVDEVDRLDDAADRLFNELLDGTPPCEDGGQTAESMSCVAPRINSVSCEPQPVQVCEAFRRTVTVLEVLDHWGLLKEGVNLRSYSMKDWRELSYAVESMYGPLPEPVPGGVSLGLFESTAVVEGRVAMTTLALPLMTYERLLLPDPVFSMLAHRASETWRCLPESGSTYFTGRKSIHTTWNTLWTARPDARKTLIQEHLPKVLVSLRQLRPLVEDGAVRLVPWESLFFSRRAEFRRIVDELRGAKPVVDATTKFDQQAYNLGHRLGAIGIHVPEDQPQLKLKKGDWLHLDDKTHAILLGLLHARICSAFGASFLPNLEGDMAIYDVLKGIGERSILTRQNIALPFLEDAAWEDIVAIRRGAPSLARLRRVISDASTLADTNGIPAIQSRLEESTSRVKEDNSLWRLAQRTRTEATVSIAIGAVSGLISGLRAFGIDADALAKVAALNSSADLPTSDTEKTEVTPKSEILVRVTNSA